MDYRRLKNVFLYGWKDAAIISEETGRNRIGLFIDMLSCFLKYYVFGYQFKKEKLYNIHGEERKEICLKLQKKNIKKIQWQNEFYDNYKFLNKWSSLKYEQSADSQKKKWAAYTKRYGFGKNCVIGHDVLLVRHHHLDGTISIGDNVLLAKHVFIDYSGEVVIKDNVGVSNGVIIETHEHPGYTNPASDIHFAKPCVLIIDDGVVIGSNAIIHASVGRIGRNSRVGAGAVLRQSVPPYAIVMGNPAKIVGFSMTPEQVEEYERDKYPENERISIEKYTKDYNKLFLDRIDEIKQFLKKLC